MRVLITGGAGFIGSHLCDALVAKNFQVKILDNLSTGNENNILQLKGKAEFFEGDIRDIELVEELVSESDKVFHLAAAVGVKTIIEKPIESMSTNFAGSEIILNACTKLRKKVVIASTSEIYGKNNNQPLSEGDDRVMGAPQKLRWSYADAKALEEAMAYALFLSKGLDVVTLRFFNIVGPRQLSSYGMVLPNFVKAALSNKPIEIFGTGNQKRVFCHVEDAVEAILKLANNKSAGGEVFNIGGNEEVSINALANLVKEILGSKSEIRFIPYERAYGKGFEDMQRRVPNLSKIRKYIDWTPRLDLRQIIEDIAKSMS
jgi:UDP-glucose 4-epimerase